MRTILSFAALVAFGLAVPTTDLDGWAEFKAKFGKAYADPKEELMRKENFMQAKAMIDKHNAVFAAGLSTYEMGLNQYSDLSQDELKTYVMGLRLPEQEVESEYHELSGESIPSSVDWRKHGAVSPVGNQLHCGSCYAFSAVGSLEGLLAIKNKKLVPLSVQEIVDCIFDGCLSCAGGYPWSIFPDITKSAIYDTMGLESEADYPYTGELGDCRYNSSKIAAFDFGYKKVPKTEKALKDAVSKIGPISVGIHAGGDWVSYNQGIFNDLEDCDPTTRADHAVLVVGYGEENGTEYWIVKNSWGDSWGEKGYIRMEIGSNLCGIANNATYPIV